MRRLLSRISAAAVLAVAGCHTCDVCDDCGDGYGCGGGSYHARNYGDPGYAPGYVATETEGATAAASKRIPMQSLAATPKKTIAAQPSSTRVIR